jgi:hypothetical protein
MFEADALHLFVRHKHAATFVILPLHFLPLLLFLPLFGLAVDLPLQLRTLHLP